MEITKLMISNYMRVHFSGWIFMCICICMHVHGCAFARMGVFVCNHIIFVFHLRLFRLFRAWKQ